MIDCGCGSSKKKFAEGGDFIYQNFKALEKVKQGKNYRSYPKPESIIDFDFVAGGEVKTMKKEKGKPKSGKMKMKTYEGENAKM